MKRSYRMLSPGQRSKPGECEIPRVRIYEYEAQLIAQEAASWPNQETGGHVFGYWDSRGNAIGHFFWGPGPHAIHAYAHFEEDAEFLRQTYAQANRLHGVDIVMRVHSHHGLGLTRPSPGDARSQASLMARNGFRRMVELIVTFADANTPDGSTRLNDKPFSHVTGGGHCHAARKYEELKKDCAVSEPVGIRMHCYLHEPLNGGYHPCALSLIPGVSPLREALFGMTEDKVGLASGIQRKSVGKESPRDFSPTVSGDSLARLIDQLKQECAGLPRVVREACEYIPSDDFVVVKVPAMGKKLLVAYRPEIRVRVEAVYIQSDDIDGPLLNITAEALGRNKTFSLVETLRAVQDHAWPHDPSAARLPESNVEESNPGCPESLAAREMPSSTAKARDVGMEG